MAITPTLARRTSTPGNSPAPGSLQPGQLAVEMNTPTRLWVGVPIADDPNQQKLLIDTSVPPGSMVEPVGAGTWGRLETSLWERSVALSGDMMTGGLSIAPSAPGAWAVMELRAQVGAGTQFSFHSLASPRWGIQGAAPAEETGGNVGSDFALISYDDTGTWLRGPLTINRASGVMNLSALPTVGGLPLPYVAKAGDTMTGGLTIAPPGGWASLVLNNLVPASSSSIISTLAGVTRWQITMDADLAVQRFDAAGGWLGSPMVIRGGNGYTEFSGGVQVNGQGGLSLYTGATGALMAIDMANGNLVFNKFQGTAWAAAYGWFSNATNRFCAELEANGLGITYSWYGPSKFALQWDGVNILHGIDNAVWHWYTLASDERLKSDIAPSTFDGLAVIKTVPLYQFRWKDHTIPGQPVDDPTAPIQPIGFVSQRTESSFPSAIGRPKPSAATEGAMLVESLNPLTLIAAAYDAIKQLDARLTAGGL